MTTLYIKIMTTCIEDNIITKYGSSNNEPMHGTVEASQVEHVNKNKIFQLPWLVKIQ